MANRNRKSVLSLLLLLSLSLLVSLPGSCTALGLGHSYKSAPPTPSAPPPASVPLKSIRSSLFNSSLPDSAAYAPPLNPGFSKFQVKEPPATTPEDHPVLRALEAARKGEALEEGTSIALSLEGGGMRGSLSAGMASALSLLSLSPHFSRVYGSSAGSIVGSYLVSRQMCVDVYSDILPMNDRFLQKRRIIGEIVKSGGKWVRRGGKMVRVKREGKGGEEGAEIPADKSSRPKRLMRRLRFRRRSSSASPSIAPSGPDQEGYYDATGMNVSYVLSSVLSSTGLRPLDYLSFHSNSATQSLNVLSSCSDFTTKSWNGTHYFTTTPHSPPPDPRNLGSTFFSCLSSSMIVPGAGGRPVNVSDSSSLPGSSSSLCFDAFVYEPIPLRTPVSHGATHVVALRTRPQCSKLKTARGLYERAVAPAYFEEHGMPDVAEWYARGGQQFRYCEDVACCWEGLKGGKVKVPPTDVVYGRSGVTWGWVRERVDESKWDEAYVLPVQVGPDVPEVSALEQRREVIVEGIRDGFVAAYDVFKGAAGAELPEGVTSADLAELLFPVPEDGGDMRQVRVKGWGKGGPTPFTKPKKRGRVKALVSRRERRRRRLLKERGARGGGEWEEVARALPDVDKFGWLSSRLRAEVKEKGGMRKAIDFRRSKERESETQQ